MESSKPVTRITMFKVPSEEGQQKLIQGYETLAAESKKVITIERKKPILPPISPPPLYLYPPN